MCERKGTYNGQCKVVWICTDWSIINQVDEIDEIDEIYEDNKDEDDVDAYDGVDV